MDVFITEIDGVLCSNEMRTRAAQNTTLATMGLSAIALPPTGSLKKQYDKIFYSSNGVFNPDAVELDTLLSEEVAQAFRQLVSEMDATIILSSRPNWMHEATIQWLEKYHLWHGSKMDIVCKPYGTRVQYLKNTDWFAAYIAEAVKQFDMTLFVHTSREITKSVVATTRPQAFGTRKLNIAMSCLEAVAMKSMIDDSERE